MVRLSNNILVSSCPICGNKGHKVLFHDRNRRGDVDCFGTYIQCSECSAVYLRERPEWDRIVSFYHAHQRPLEPVPGWKRFLRRFRFRPHSWPLESQREVIHYATKNILDVGCGAGKKLMEFYERGYKVWGIDVDANAIKICRKLMPRGCFVQGEIQDISLPKFDYIRIDNTLEHIPNLREVITKCHDLLKNDGQLLIYVPHGRSLSMRCLKGKSVSSWIPFHLQLFTRKSIKHLLNNAGFKTKVYGYYPDSWLPLSFTQNYPAWLKLGLYPIGWVASKIGLAEELVGIGVL